MIRRALGYLALVNPIVWAIVGTVALVSAACFLCQSVGPGS